MAQNALVILALPLLAFILIVFVTRRSKPLSASVAIIARAIVASVAFISRVLCVVSFNSAVPHSGSIQTSCFAAMGKRRPTPKAFSEILIPGAACWRL